MFPKSDDLNDSLDDLLGGKITGERPALPAHYKPRDVAKVFEEPCKACKGRGRFISWAGRDCGPCFKCKGAGKKQFKTSPETRAHAQELKQAADRRRAEEKGKALATWIEAHKAEVDWIAAAAKRNAERGGTFTFPQSLLDAIAKFGELTENQLAAVRRLIAKDAERAQAKQAAVANAPAIDVTKIAEAFDRARSDAQEAGAEGVRWLTLRLDTFEFLDMPARGQWKAAIRVTEGDVKLGRIEAGKFVRFAACTDEQLARILAAAADPLAAAKAYGLRFSSCSCCGRELTNPESIALGIGPICAEKWFCA